MKKKSAKYKGYSLVSEMLETVDVVKNFSSAKARPFAKELKKVDNVLLTGEGSSRIFPAKNIISKMLSWGIKKPVFTEGGRQALDYDLKKFGIFGASNSGKTKELIELYKSLKKKNIKKLFGLTATPGSPLEKISAATHVLGCGKEEAVAATKSVVEQGLFYHAVFANMAGKEKAEFKNLGKLATAMEKVLTQNIPASIVDAAAGANRIYFAGRNDGVAEELTLKTNEITRKPSAYLEGTYAVHGIEEVMEKKDVVVVIDPFAKEVDKFRECLEKGVGLKLVAISTKKLPVPTIVIPKCANFDTYLQLAAGWNLLVEIGIKKKVTLDTTVRARKIGNEA
ncbi:MAG: SIS domain-containing protein [Planctomycetota bacterium]|jgi:glucosamine--fructose-6-phosphate aminotransferase (isomerizing)